MIKYGRIVGTVIATIKYPGLQGVKLLIVQPLNRRLEPIGISEVAVDTVKAGVGDICVLTKSHEASMTLKNPNVPVDLATVGVVDIFSYLESMDQSKCLNKGTNKFA